MRKPTACVQCRRTKLACDGNRPCQRCISRDQASLCTSQIINPTTKQEPTSRDGSQSLSRDASSSQTPGYAQSPPSITTKSTTVIDPDTGEIVYVGESASILYFQAFTGLPMNDVLSAFMLRNESTLHPFGTLWRPGWDPQDVFDALPETQSCLKYFEAYKEGSRQYYFPQCIDLVDFEQRMVFILQRRDNLIAAIEDNFSTDRVSRRDAWCGLWFAIIAAGYQWSASDDVTVKVFGELLRQPGLANNSVACSFEFLRRAHIYACSSIEILQTLLLLVAIMCNAGNPGMAWHLLGSTWRPACGIGLAECSSGPLADALWQSMVELDASISYPFGRLPLAGLQCKARVNKLASNENMIKPVSSPEQLIKRLQHIRMDFQNHDWPKLPHKQKVNWLNMSLTKLDILFGLLNSSSTTTADTIRDVEVFTILATRFKADLCHLFSVTENDLDRRATAIGLYHEVLLSYDRLSGFQSANKSSWVIRQAVTDSALMLAALDHDGTSSTFQEITQRVTLSLEPVLSIPDIAMDIEGGSSSGAPVRASTLIARLYSVN